jgi:hypothetical protein
MACSSSLPEVTTSMVVPLDAAVVNDENVTLVSRSGLDQLGGRTGVQPQLVDNGYFLALHGSVSSSVLIVL